jgi:anti-sigma regulatory factor (Ser/Thr protein kinase)
MTAHRAVAQADTDVMTHACLIADREPDMTRCWSPAHNHFTITQPAASCALGPRPESVAQAREFTRIALRDWGLAGLLAEAELVISELVTNALRHGLPRPASRSGGSRYPIQLRLMAQAPYLMCMVTDPSRAIPLRRDYDADAETGRGLQVIESCCSRWGWHLLDEGGKMVWALLPTESSRLL